VRFRGIHSRCSQGSARGLQQSNTLSKGSKQQRQGGATGKEAAAAEEPQLKPHHEFVVSKTFPTLTLKSLECRYRAAAAAAAQRVADQESWLLGVGSGVLVTG
jgi:hypothetical protein